MASYNLTQVAISGYTDVNDGLQVAEYANRALRKRKINFATLISTAPGAPALTLAQNDLLAAIPVFQGDFVRNVMIRVLTADTAAGANVNVAVGDAVTGTPSAAATGWISTFDLKSTAGTYKQPDVHAASYIAQPAATTPTSTTFIGVGKQYTADGSIDIKLLGTGTTLPTNAVIEIVVDVVPAFPQ